MNLFLICLLLQLSESAHTQQSYTVCQLQATSSLNQHVHSPDYLPTLRAMDIYLLHSPLAKKYNTKPLLVVLRASDSGTST
jgi:hypothetical protein